MMYFVNNIVNQMHSVEHFRLLKHQVHALLHRVV